MAMQPSRFRDLLLTPPKRWLAEVAAAHQSARGPKAAFVHCTNSALSASHTQRCTPKGTPSTRPQPISQELRDANPSTSRLPASPFYAHDRSQIRCQRDACYDVRHDAIWRTRSITGTKSKSGWRTIHYCLQLFRKPAKSGYAR
jgi:hypothetical protein